jgi:hypothetical protein
MQLLFTQAERLTQPNTEQRRIQRPLHGVTGAQISRQRQRHNNFGLSQPGMRLSSQISRPYQIGFSPELYSNFEA